MVGAGGMNAKREASNDVVDEINGIGLSVALVDFEGSDSGGVINGRVLETPRLFTV